MSEVPRKFRKSSACFVAAIALTGCSKTVGNGFVSPKGECVPYLSTVELKPEQKLYLSVDDMSIDPDRSISDMFIISNNQGYLEVQSREGDDGTTTLRSGDSSATIEEDIVLGITGDEYQLTNIESGNKVTITSQQIDDKHLIVKLDQICED